jgi:rfaE bifunctional protein nucleotidyltransferase chain/domain
MHRLEWIQNKIHSREALLQHRNAWRALGQKVVFTNGCFDILHHGHLDLIAKSADLGNVLIVAINTDDSVKRLKGPERPLNHEQDRAFQLASLLCVDAVTFFNEDTPAELIELLKPDILVKGGDYSMEGIVGAEFVTGYGGRVEIIPFVQGYSTSSLIDRIKKL